MEETPKPRLHQADRTVVLPAMVLDDLIGPDHPAWAVRDYVPALDLTPLLSVIRAVVGVPGRNATDPRILLALWMRATGDGIGTARAVDELCRAHHACRRRSGGVPLNDHTPASFRSGREAVLDGFLASHVSALPHQGLIDLSCVAQDGMRTRAGSGTGSFRRAVSIDECQKLVREQIEELKRQKDEPPDAVPRRQQAAKARHARDRLEQLKAARQAAEESGAKQAERVRLHPKEGVARPDGNDAGEGVVQERASTAEWVNAGMRHRGLTRFTVRGLAKTRAVVWWQALVHNLWQTIRLLDAKKDGRNRAEILRADAT